MMNNRTKGTLMATLAGGLIHLSLFAPVHAQTIRPSLLPDANQKAMMDRQFGMFIHFGINTFSGEEWTDGTLKPELYAPQQVDTDQWAKTAKDAGMSYVILITKHHEGFCLWDSKFTEYDVASSPVKTDVIAAMAKSCKKYGIKLGLYYSLWDRNWNQGMMRANKGKLTKEQSDQYVQYMENQLTEILTNYGDVCELWFDGGWILPRENWQIERVYQHVKKLQPKCLVGVNWSIGKFDNLDFHPVQPKAYQTGLPIRYFPSDFRLGDPMLPEFPDIKHYSGPDGLMYYMPFETTVCLNKKWFWQPDDQHTRSVEELLPLFERSTAQGNVLILNSPPNRQGKMEDRNIQRLKELAVALGAKPGKKIPSNVAERASAYATSTALGKSVDASAKSVLDGNPDTRWIAANAPAQLVLQWPTEESMNFLRIREHGEKQGQEVQYGIEQYQIEALIQGKWQVIHEGTTIGNNAVIEFKKITTKAVRVKIIKAKTPPSISHVAAGLNHE